MALPQLWLLACLIKTDQLGLRRVRASKLPQFPKINRRNQLCVRKTRVEEHGLAVFLEQSDAVSMVRLEDAIGIDCAAELKELLVRGLQPGLALHVSLEKATSLDATAIQLLLAALREAKKIGVQFVVDGGVPQPVRSAVVTAGIGEFPVPA